MGDGNAYELLLDLFETKIEQLADEIENIYSDLEQLGRQQLPDKNARAGGEPRPRLENACGYPLTAAR
ncbi:hypothetical protein BK354_25960 [Escherichia coli]|nr:hypothetical protein BK354_25960 [Escherichia coli]